jgi:hypothetical protein
MRLSPGAYEFIVRSTQAPDSGDIWIFVQGGAVSDHDRYEPEAPQGRKVLGEVTPTRAVTRSSVPYFGGLRAPRVPSSDSMRSSSCWRWRSSTRRYSGRCNGPAPRLTPRAPAARVSGLGRLGPRTLPARRPDRSSPLPGSSSAKLETAGSGSNGSRRVSPRSTSIGARTVSRRPSSSIHVPGRSAIGAGKSSRDRSTRALRSRLRDSSLSAASA